MSQQESISVDTASQSQVTRSAILLDTDIGDDIDDALALALALNSPEIELLGVTTVFGDTHKRAQLARYMLHVFGREDIPVAIGSGTPLQQHHAPSGVAQAAILEQCVFDQNMFSSLSGPELIVQKALERQGQLTLVCIGPLTNVAQALLIEPRIISAIRSIVLMGGSSSIPFPEWNMRSDARAAHIVLHSGIPITLLGWNITTRCKFHTRDLERLRNTHTQQAQLLAQLVTIWQHQRPRWKHRTLYLHDPLTIAALCKPELLRWQTLSVALLIREPLTGFMIPRFSRGSSVQAAIDVHANDARAWILQRLLHIC